MKFSHIADCHLGSWRQPQLSFLNFKSFQKAIETSIKEKVDFVLIAGDLFDSAYPSIDTLKNTFREFRKLKESNIPVFLIAGSHDYSVSGKTFLDVLEKAGLCKNVCSFEKKGEKIMLLPTIYKNIAIYGYPGKKSGLEVDEVEKIILQDSPGLFRILMLHTTIDEAVSNPQIKYVRRHTIPNVDYLALGHLHINYSKNKLVYPGPTFPNSISELEDLESGSFCIVDNGEIKKQEIKLKDVLTSNITIESALTATEKIIDTINNLDIRDRIFILKLSGFLQSGKVSDIDFHKIERHAMKNGAYVFLKSTSNLHSTELDLGRGITDTEDLETKIISDFIGANPNKFNVLIHSLIKSLQMEKLEDEKSSIFEERLLSEARKVIRYENKENFT